MYRLHLFAVALLSVRTTIAHGQRVEPIRRYEVGVDAGYQVNRGDDIARSNNAPISIRYGAVNSQYRFTIDQRATFGDRRVYGAKAPVLLDTQFGWRLGSAAKVHSTVLGPYLLGSFNLSGPHPYFEKVSRYRAGVGFGAGVGTRISLLGVIVRPELVVAHDLSSGTRGEPYWIPSRNRVGVRLGYGHHFDAGNH